MGKIIIHLQPQPGVSGASERSFKTDSRFRRHPTAPGNHVVKLLARNTQTFRGFRDA